MKFEDRSYYYYSREINYKQWSLEMYSKFFFKNNGAFRPYAGVGIGYKNLAMNYDKLNFYESYYSNNKGVRGHSFFASALIGTEFYFNSQFGLNAHFKYSKALKTKIDERQIAGGKRGLYNYYNYYSNGSKLNQAAKKVSSIGYKSIYLGIIIKL